MTVAFAKVAVAVASCIVAPLVVLFVRPHAEWSYMDALCQRILSCMTPLDVAVVRCGFAWFGRLQRLVYWPAAVVDSPTVKGLWYGDATTPLCDAVVILFVHGGGFLSGTADCMSTGLFQPLLGRLQNSLRAVRLFSVEYDLAPEHPYPRAINQALDAYLWLLDQGVASTNILLMGDSAGGNAVLSLLQRGRQQNVAMPACGVLISPWVDLSVSTPSYDVKTDIFTKNTIVAWRNLYLGNDLTKMIEASPGLQPLEGLPPLLVMYGQTELMANDISAFCAKAKHTHLDLTEYVHPHLYHDFVMLPLGKPSHDAVAAIARFAESKMQ